MAVDACICSLGTRGCSHTVCCLSAAPPEAGSLQQYSCKEVHGNMISGECMFLHMFEDEHEDREPKNTLS